VTRSEGNYMAMTTTAEAIEAMMADDGVSIVKPEVGAIEAITRSEVAMQLDSAHRWPRSVSKFLRDAGSLATFSVEIAESCMYSVPRGGKMITGPSVRLAEMCATSWGNLHVGARVIEATETEVIAQAVAWDLERNVRLTVEAQRSIVGKKGRFDDDMIRVTGMAAISIALRNAIFRVIPRAYVQAIYDKAHQCAVGDLKTLATRRDDAFARFAKLGVTPERMFARLDIKGPDDFTLEHLEQLIGMHTAIKSGELQIDAAFPAPAASPVPAGTPEGQRVKMPGKSAPKKQPTPGEGVANGAAAQATEARASTPPPSAPAPAAAPADLVDRVRLLQMLREVDPAWDDPDLDAQSTIAAWTESECAEAQKWVHGYLNNVPRNIRRPAHTMLTREPGQEG
jgi:hypothetical protein